jgi:hypothetical protein
LQVPGMTKVGYRYEKTGLGWVGYVTYRGDGRIGSCSGPYLALSERGMRRKLERKSNRARRWKNGRRVVVEPR